MRPDGEASLPPVIQLKKKVLAHFPGKDIIVLLNWAETTLSLPFILLTFLSFNSGVVNEWVIGNVTWYLRNRAEHAHSGMRHDRVAPRL